MIGCGMRKRKRGRAQAVALFLLVLLVSYAAPASTENAPRNVTILYTNDFHAAVEPMTATWLVDQPPIGGVRALSAWIAMFRRTRSDAFLFDSGDLFTGQAISFLTRGRALIDLWKAIGFDAVCLGNHEFDYGLEGATAYVKGEPFPVLSANLFYKGTDRPFARPYAIVENHGIRVGVIGIFGVDAVPSTNVHTWDTLEARDPVPILRRLVPELRKQVDLIVVLAHQGETGPMQSDAEAHPEIQRNFDADKATVAAVPGIDVFVGGHAHRGIEVPWVSPRTGSIVVQTYGRGTTLGVLELKLDMLHHKVVSHHGALIRVMPGIFPVPPAVSKTAGRWERKAKQAASEVVAQTTVAFSRHYNAESPLGDLLCDAMLWKTGAQVAFSNAGGLRADLPRGVITRGDLISAFPFINTVVTMDLTGKQIRNVLEQSLTQKVGMMQVAGIKATYDLGRPEYQRLVSVQADGEPLQDERTYHVVTNSFVAGGGDHYGTFLEASGSRDSGMLLSDLLYEYASEKKVLDPPADGRLVPVEPQGSPKL